MKVRLLHFVVLLVSVALAGFHSSNETRAHEGAIAAVCALMQVGKGPAHDQPTTGNDQPGGPKSVVPNNTQDRALKTDQPMMRPTEPNTSSDTQSMKPKPCADGSIRLDLGGERWADVLQMLADLSGMTLEWTALPDDLVDLKTRDHLGRGG